ncbi:MAG: protease modulator HflC [Pseudomonadota bacterium]|nr:protease modulator HflC [Pseudomonadota bacterium]MEC8463539.1 protease modulator HflC [Pseudomonadota bacterium]MEC8531797.1 protease modulator HflC [Pseudomonadota bacterium]MEC8725532.1 protease modulator HflC [Pseudomonadota bacterium]
MTNLRLIIVGVLVILGGIVAFSSLYTVHQTQQALILEFGQPRHEEPRPGLHAKLPWRTATYYDKRILSLDPPAQEIILADQKRIIVDAFVRYRIVSPLRFKLRADTELNFIDIFGRILNSGVRAQVGRVLLADMLSNKRDVVMNRITDELKRQAKDFGIVVVDVRIGRTDLPPTTSESVYNRMQSQREAQAAKLRAEGAEIRARIEAEANRDRTIIIAEAQREAQILRGEGEGERTRILNDAFGKDPEFFAFYRSMEAYDAALSDGTTMVLSPDSEFFRFFNDLPGDSSRGRSSIDK